MGERILIDTNIEIYFVDGVLKETANTFVKGVLFSEILISVITEIKILCFNPTNADDSIKIKQFTNDCLILQLEKAVVEKTIEIKKVVKIRLPDAIIAATALVNNFTLATRNEKDFLKVTGLKVVNPFTL